MQEGELLLLIIVIAFTIAIYILIEFIKKFIQSRPPGRRLVTSDIQVCVCVKIKYSGWILILFIGSSTESDVHGGDLSDGADGRKGLLWTGAFCRGIPRH